MLFPPLEAHIDESAINVPTLIVVSESRTLKQTIAALPLETDGKGRARLGSIRQLQAGLTVDMRGRGFNERTVTVCCCNRFYFIFRADLNEPAVNVAAPVSKANAGSG